MSNVNFHNVQGNILKEFGKDHVRFIFFNIEDIDRATDWFRLLVEAKRIPSTSDLIDAANRMKEGFKKDPYFKPSDTWIHVAFSANGMKKLGLELPPSHNAYGFQKFDPKKPDEDPEISLQNRNVVVDQNDPFNAGMKKRSTILEDTEKDDPSNWIEPFNRKSDLIHGVLRIDSDEPEDADKTVVDFLGEFTKRGIVFLGLEKGTAVLNAHGKHVEHFGFRDGVSQPLFEGIDDEEIKNRHVEIDKHDPRKFVLFGLDGNRSWANDGSFMVFRRLSQDFEGFWNFMDHNSHDLGLAPEGLAARFVGRWKSGAPLARFQDGDPTLPAEFDDNDFKYLENKEEDSGTTVRDPTGKKFIPAENDPTGKNTPRFAHIRKVYPRDDGLSDNPKENDFEVDQHRIVRRGIAFGPKFADEPEGERGLLFVCHQVDLENQFEFIQRNWANNPHFPADDPGAPEGHGFDAIIGKHHDKGFVNLLKDNTTTPHKFRKITGLKQWVTTTGGEYFFSPSIPALKSLKGKKASG